MDAKSVQRGDSVDFTPSEDVAAGDVVIKSKLVGIAKLDIKAHELGALALEGVFEMPKSTGTAFGFGTTVAWNPTTRKVVSAATSSDFKIGHVVAQAGGADTTVLVRLCQGMN